MGDHKGPGILLRQLASDMFTKLPANDNLDEHDREIIQRIIQRSNSRSLIVRWFYTPVILRWRTRIQSLYNPRHSERKRD